MPLTHVLLAVAILLVESHISFRLRLGRRLTWVCLRIDHLVSASLNHTGTCYKWARMKCRKKQHCIQVWANCTCNEWLVQFCWCGLFVCQGCWSWATGNCWISIGQGNSWGNTSSCKEIVMNEYILRSVMCFVPCYLYQKTVVLLVY